MFLYFQSSYSTASPADRYPQSNFDTSVCTPNSNSMATDISTYQTSYPNTPMTSPMTTFTDSTSYGGETPMGDSPFGYETLSTGGNTNQAAPAAPSTPLQGFNDPPSPISSVAETYNIHGTYTYMRDDGKAGDLISSFRDENTCNSAPNPGSPEDTKFSNTSLFHYSQYQSFPDEISFIKQQGAFAVDNQADFYKQPQQQQQQPHPQQQQQQSQHSGSTGFPSPVPQDFQYPPDQKEAVFQNLSGFQGNQAVFADRGGYQNYQTGFYDNQRLQDSNFNFQLPTHAASMFREGSLNVHGRNMYQRRGASNTDR